MNGRQGKIKTVLLAYLVSVCSFALEVRAWVCIPPCNASACYACEDSVCVYQCDGWLCKECVDGSCTSKCTGCERCHNSFCEDDDTKCPGECERCRDAACTNFDVLCAWCENCDSNGDCVDDGTSCTGCKTCSGGPGGAICADDDDACENCDKCVDGTCVPGGLCEAGQCCDEGTCVVDCPTGKCCSGGICVSSCPSGQCCDDGTCVPKCELSPTGHCDTSDSYGCIGCTVWGNCGDFTTRVYSGNVTYNCIEPGCPGDCAWDAPVLCYTEYDCTREFDILSGWLCRVEEEGTACHNYHGPPEWFCIPCKKDTDDPGEPVMVSGKKCVE